MRVYGNVMNIQKNNMTKEEAPTNTKVVEEQAPKEAAPVALTCEGKYLY